MRPYLAILLLALPAFAQYPTVTVAQTPPTNPSTTLMDYDGSGNLIYVGWALAAQRSRPLTVTSWSKANPGVITVTAHGLLTGNPIVVTGATGDWAAVNGTHYITVTGANTFTVAIDTSGFSGTFNGTVTTTAPSQGQPVWTIQKMTYSGSNATAVQFATCNPSCIWSNRAVTTGATAITWR